MQRTVAANAERIRQIKSFPSLVKYLRDELNWPIEADDFEDLTYDWEPEELGIDKASAAKIDEVKQLRPLADDQPWGIFFVKFEPKKLPVVALRRLLNSMVVRKRQSANKSERQAWAMNDLMFISSYGDSGERHISFAHFSQPEGKNDLPTLKVLGWDNSDTPLHLDLVAFKLAECLAWPDDEGDVDGWRETWQSAFTLRHRQTINTAKDLSIRLAELSRAIRDRITTALAIETEKGPLTKLMNAFQSALMHDLKADGFADMYAQTIAYGLLSARIADPKSRTADDLTAHMKTSPFLKELMQTFLHVGGRKGKAGGPGIDFDELGVSEVVELLDDADMEAVIRDFGDKKRDEDPVMHFYESFLHEFNKQLKIQRGVFYTPQPVVSYIVRSVHELLQNEFGLADGLADTTTWGQMLKKHPGLKLPPLTDELGEKRTISLDEPFVQILDPATGTATFLVEVIEVIHATLKAKWKQQRLTEAQQTKAWNDYVPKHLLPRLHAYELMMAPYAIAHMKIGLKLAETGYGFGSEERARIFLTNALEPWQSQLKLPELDALAHESAAVNEIKRHKRFTVVIGNPPYSSSSQNRQQWIMNLIEGYKATVRGAETQIQALSDDYVKFIRLAQYNIEQAGRGVIGFITNNNFQSATTFRDMRESLLHRFNLARVVDLHGNGRLAETAPDGTADQNVFDILAGVCVSILAVTPNPTSIRSRSDLLGARLDKYSWLAERTSAADFIAFEACPPQYSFLALESQLLSEYESGVFLPEIFGTGNYQNDKTTWYGSGFKTQQDEFAIGFTKPEIIENVRILLDPSTTETGLRAKFSMCGTSQWSFSTARHELSSINWEELVSSCTYRPFDTRFTVLHRGVVSNMRAQVMAQFLKPNLGLCVGRQGQAVPGQWNIVFATRYPEDQNLFYRGGNTNFPLYWYSTDSGLGLTPQRRPNLSHTFLVRFAAAFSLPIEQTSGIPEGIVPEDILNYIYALLHSLSYRKRYSEFLKTDFPRLPLPRGLELLQALAKLGGKLMALHLFETPELDQLITEFIGSRNPEVEKTSWSNNTVWVNKAQSIGFMGVPEEVWNFQIGGYQVCAKWLKDRKGRTLSKDDIAHYQKIVVAISETIRLMAEIDQVIYKHGGWPEAFQNNKNV